MAFKILGQWVRRLGREVKKRGLLRRRGFKKIGRHTYTNIKELTREERGIAEAWGLAMKTNSALRALPPEKRKEVEARVNFYRKSIEGAENKSRLGELSKVIAEASLPEAVKDLFQRMIELRKNKF